MPWVRIDEKMARHPKVVQAGPLALALQVAGLCYSNEHQTEGFIPRAVARTLLDFHGLAYVTTSNGSGFGQGEDVTPAMIIDQLVDSGIWLESGGGYQIHDYLDYQPSKEEVEAAKQQRREAGRRGGQARSARRDTQKKGNDTASEPPTEPLSEPLAGRLANAQAKSKPVPVPDPISVLHAHAEGLTADVALDHWARAKNIKPNQWYHRRWRQHAQNFLDQHPDLTASQLAAFIAWAAKTGVHGPAGWADFWTSWPGASTSDGKPDCKTCGNTRIVWQDDTGNPASPDQDGAHAHWCPDCSGEP